MTNPSIQMPGTDVGATTATPLWSMKDVANLKPGEAREMLSTARSIAGVEFVGAVGTLALAVSIACPQSDKLRGDGNYLVAGTLIDEHCSPMASFRGYLSASGASASTPGWNLLYTDVDSTLRDAVTPAQLLGLTGEATAAICDTITSDGPISLAVGYAQGFMDFGELDAAVLALPGTDAFKPGESYTQDAYLLPAPVIELHTPRAAKLATRHPV